MRIAHILTVFGLSLLAAHAQAAGSPEDIARQWCANCHRADGNSVSPLFPRLAGQQPAYLEQQLRAFRANNRSDQSAHDYMWGVAGTLDDATISGLAAYFAAQKPQPDHAPVDRTLLSAGNELYHNGRPASGTTACAACHGAKAEGTEVAPRLANQHAAYIVKQLHVFETSQRPAATAMQSIIKTLSENDMQALGAYVQTLQ
ncbi:cytochrome c, class I [Pseudogulbenkiania sp. NH8B]|uniref:c-type cytochrome n=1 Tax=Pseudogulbenkiania sp. (strain NH8B) TaxID=748280 RepID=UPI000227A837|nr:c-type cytochrome [Pseudogulbenkiania sp. NH8B]BAK78472.1 cytochrome c, class I [Pseudogulbenkiania sp. NH8B]